ncbi:hypothetical protein NQZ68_011154 [Dissostichus eleginoides]|nr:hypothetical protein NQZ68_011154 [Dissostichus eleginoides]
MRLRLSSLFEQGVLQKSEFGAAGVVPVVVQTAGLTFEQQKELSAMQFEQEKLQLRGQQQEVEKRFRGGEGAGEKCSGVIGDVEKMVAIPAVVQSFHQAPPVDLQVRGDPRAPEWANVIIAEERVIGRISVRCWNLRGSLPQGVGSGMVPDKKLVCADLDVGSGFEPFITEAVVSVVGSDKYVPIKVLRDTAARYSFIVESVLPFSTDWGFCADEGHGDGLDSCATSYNIAGL